MDDMDDIACTLCGEKSGFDEDSGYYYCRSCFSQADGLMDTAVQAEDFLDKSKTNFHLSVHRLKNTQVKMENVTLLAQSKSQQPSGWDGHKIPKEECNEEEPCVLHDFGVSIDVSQLTLEDLSSKIRIRYVMGIQLMIQYQCEALVEKFGVDPLICGFSGVIWMRYVAATRVFDERWADKTFEDSEVQYKGTSEERTTQSRRKGTFNMYGQSAVMIWFRSLRKSIPLSTSLAVTFLACHLAREPILPTDIHTWSVEGKLPYLTAFLDIEKSFGSHPSAFPLSPSIMFRPYKVIGSMELEAQTGFVAQSIGLQLPPVNFFAIASRYLMELSLPEEKILPHATKIFEWAMPPDLWLSANPHRLPSRVCVMSIILLTLRLLYNINGFGKWEESLSELNISSDQTRNGDGECVKPLNISTTPKKQVATTPGTKKRKNSRQCRKVNSKAVRGMLDIQDSEYDSRELLDSLEAVYKKTHGEHESSKDLLTYLEYCKGAVLAGLKPIVADNKEERIIEELWNYYKHQEDSDVSGKPNSSSMVEKSTNNRPNKGTFISDTNKCNISCTPMTKQNFTKSMQWSQGEDDNFPKEQAHHTAKEMAIKQMKLNMEENGFCYIPPRCKLRRLDHLHYIRKNDGGTRSYVAHADYYILVRACAQVAKVGVRYMHAGALKLEKRLSWIENRIDQSLQFVSQNPSPQSNDDVHPSKDICDDVQPHSNDDNDRPPKDIDEDVDMTKDSEDDVDLPEGVEIMRWQETNQNLA